MGGECAGIFKPPVAGHMRLRVFSHQKRASIDMRFSKALRVDKCLLRMLSAEQSFCWERWHSHDVIMSVLESLGNKIFEISSYTSSIAEGEHRRSAADLKTPTGRAGKTPLFNLANGGATDRVSEALATKAVKILRLTVTSYTTLRRYGSAVSRIG
jgi:hypothetical protein